jgi:hypothetical protein
LATVLKKPALFKVLAIFGLILGGFGSLYSFASSMPLLSSRDQYVAIYREAAEKQSAVVPTPALRDELVHMYERQADTVYSRRGVQLPLAAMNIILSMLLFAGCTRALRGQGWGLSAWTMAALASIPYTVLDVAFSVVQARDLSAVFRETAGPMGLLSTSWLTIQTMLTMLKATAELLYFGACLLYLRTAQIRKLFLPPAAQ